MTPLCRVKSDKVLCDIDDLYHHKKIQAERNRMEIHLDINFAPNLRAVAADDDFLPHFSMCPLTGLSITEGGQPASCSLTFFGVFSSQIFLDS